ncbi:disulfide bond formation protein B [Magnetospira sp. QH-2]|uniref:disulfide bond formation protein B n=1 Tax=Magnetospira sp. (strain QH-2) TaxID=1288970 RepID=UPI0003E815DB|nr:disulfide bond formation protein B [Magnetospira sp. QH-2]CCQ75447.1 putative Disulfide bond formation protein DsbB [Magnetospira sp. QH-2]
MIILHPKSVALFVLATSVGSLAFAYGAQYLFHMQPCILCLYQRIPFAVAGGLALLVLLLPRLAVPVLMLVALAFLVGAGIAGYHVGVEQHWWTGTAGCTGEIDTTQSLQDLKAQLMATPLKRCDEITWAVFGISVTVLNVLWSLLLAAATLYGVNACKRERRQ